MENLNECPICYNSLNLNKKYNCCHNICNECFVSWSNINKTCPMCREMELESFNKLYFLILNEYCDAIKIFNNLDLDAINDNNLIFLIIKMYIYNKQLILLIIKIYMTKLNDNQPSFDETIKLNLTDFIKSSLFHKFLYAVFKL